jgi:hypothetical protein
MGMHKGQTNSGSFKKRQHPWNYGLTKETDKRVKKQSDFLKGHIVTKKTRKILSIKHKGKHHSKSSKKKISIAVKNRNPEVWKKTVETRRKNNPIWHTKKTRKKIGLKVSGKNNGSWQGGISNKPYTYNFNTKLKKQIKKRDKYKCQLCKSKKDLCIHHIDYNKKHSFPKNLITLCRKCNNKVNQNRKYWKKYFKCGGNNVNI